MALSDTFLPEQISQQLHTTALLYSFPIYIAWDIIKSKLADSMTRQRKIFTQKILLRFLCSVPKRLVASLHSCCLASMQWTPSIQLHKLPILWLCSAVYAESSTLLGCRCRVFDFARFQNYGHQVFYIYPVTLQDNVVLGLVKYPELRPISPGTSATFVLTLSYLDVQPFSRLETYHLICWGSGLCFL